MERGAFDPVFKSSTVARFRHLATFFGLIPRARLSVASKACDPCIAAQTACIVVANYRMRSLMTNLFHTASVHSNEKIPLFDFGIKYLA